MKKVLVQSVYAEPVVKVGEIYSRNEKGQAIASPILRSFRGHKCYMTPEEAEFLVESKENRKNRAAGRGKYFYPAGIPVPVDADFEGPLSPAASGDSVLVMDPLQAIAAMEQTQRAEEAMQSIEGNIRASQERAERERDSKQLAGGGGGTEAAE